MTESLQLVLAFVTLISALFAGCASVYSAKSNKTNERLQQKNESLNEKIGRLIIEVKDLYLDIHQLLQIEDYLCDELNVKKQVVRKPYTFSRRIDKSNVERRISQLVNK